MDFQQVARRQVPDDIVDQLVCSMIDGSLDPGAALPSERRLAELLGVSRPAVREALQRLSASRLVDVRHGGSTTVLDYQRNAGLELLPRLLVRGGELVPVVARSIIEARLLVGPEMVRLAAGRAPGAAPAARQALTDAMAGLGAVIGPIARQRAALTFWDAVVDLADSIVFRLMYNSLRQAYEPALEALAVLLDGEVSDLDGYRAVTSAVLDGDAPGAAEATDKLLHPASEAMVRVLEVITPDDEGDET